MDLSLHPSLGNRMDPRSNRFLANKNSTFEIETIRTRSKKDIFDESIERAITYIAVSKLYCPVSECYISIKFRVIRVIVFRGGN